MLPEWFALISVFMRLVGGGQYAWGVIKGKAIPNPISWFLWGLTPLIAFFAQLTTGLSPQSLVLLALGITPLSISLLSLWRNGLRYCLTPLSIVCGLFAIIGIILWQITTLPELAIIFSIIADIFATLPTLCKAYKDPSTEYAFPYLLSAISMVITILAIHKWIFTVYAFPIYMLCINLVVFSFATFPLRQLFKSDHQENTPIK